MCETPGGSAWTEELTRMQKHQRCKTSQPRETPWLFDSQANSPKRASPEERASISDQLFDDPAVVREHDRAAFRGVHLVVRIQAEQRVSRRAEVFRAVRIIGRI